MKIAFLGTPPFAVAALEALAGAGHQIACVVAQPDRPAGRGRGLREPATKLWALGRGLPVLQPEKVRDGALAARLAGLAPEILVVVAYGRILGKDLLDLAPFGAVNVHASLLPRWRGAAPIAWAIAEGDAFTGVTIMRVDEGLDTGDILLQRATPIGPDETAEELGSRLAALGAAALVEALPLFETGKLVPVRQDHSRHTLAQVVEKEDGRLDFRLPAEKLARRIRAFTPWPGAFTTVGGKLLKVHRARPLRAVVPETAGAPVPDMARAPGTPVPDMAEMVPDHLPPGTARVSSDGILVGCGEGSALLLNEVQLEGKRRLPAAEFARGVPIHPGTLLGT